MILPQMHMLFRNNNPNPQYWSYTFNDFVYAKLFQKRKRSSFMYSDIHGR
jgi:hypothetical protein